MLCTLAVPKVIWRWSVPIQSHVTKVEPHLLVRPNPNQWNRRSAIQWYFPSQSKWVFSAFLIVPYPWNQSKIVLPGSSGFEIVAVNIFSPPNSNLKLFVLKVFDLSRFSNEVMDEETVLSSLEWTSILRLRRCCCCVN